VSGVTAIDGDVRTWSEDSNWWVCRLVCFADQLSPSIAYFPIYSPSTGTGYGTVWHLEVLEGFHTQVPVPTRVTDSSQGIVTTNVGQSLSGGPRVSAVLSKGLNGIVRDIKAGMRTAASL